MALLDKLVALVDQDDAGVSFFALKNFLSIAASALPEDGSLPRDHADRVAFRHIQKCLYELRKPSRPALRSDGIVWRGRPDFMTDQLLKELLDEVEEWRPFAEMQKWGQFISPGGQSVMSFANRPELRELIEGLCGKLNDRNYPSCLYYDLPGAHIKPHVDTDNFCVNVNLMLRHSASSERASQLIIYPFDSEPMPLRLEPGEILVMYADCVVHTRTPISDGEMVRNITFGYKPAGEVHQPPAQRGL